MAPAIGLLAVSLPAVYLIKKYFMYSEEDDEPINEILFFSKQGVSCRDHFKKETKKKPCHLVNCSFFNLSRMLEYLNNAERSLDVCLYLITVKDLGEAIIRAHKRGVKVRVVTDEDMSNGSGSQIHTFWQNGLAVRYQHKATTLMHHKFVIIDNNVTMTGSLNWTMQAICGNWDNLIITSQPGIVIGFIQEFKRLWKELE